jgi:NAD(P)H dehydrogenase (quinone)
MTQPTILITGATGKTGSAATMELLARGYPVRAMVHRQDERSARLHEAGAEIVVGSLEDIDDLTSSMTGVQRAYFCPPLQPGALRIATLFAAAAQRARLEAVVALSQWVADPLHPAVHAREKWLSARVLQSTPGLDVVIVNPGWFADNYMAALEGIVQFGLLAMPLGNGLNAPPSNADIGRVIAGALADPGPHVGKSYRPTGPRLLAPDEIAAVFAAELGRPVKYRDVPVSLFLKSARALGYPDFVITQLYWFLQDYRHNAFGVGAPTDAVLEVGGAPPEPFDQIVRAYLAAPRQRRRTAGTRLRAALHLATAAVTRPPEMPTALPELPNAALATESSDWRHSHL